VLKNQSGFLNHGIGPRPLIPKAPRICLSDEAKMKIRAAIKDEPSVDSECKKGDAVVQSQVKSGKSTKPLKSNCKSCKENTGVTPESNCSQPLILLQHLTG
jgi:hypothetical protein